MTSSPKTENLKREIGVRSLTLAIINQTIGTGIFVIPALIIVKLGAAAVITYIVCGILMFLVALCFAELGSKTTASGGVYEYIGNAYGPYAGFLANNIYWFGGCVIGDAAIANALADTLKYFFPSLSNEIFRAGFFILVFGGIAWLNIRSVKNGVRFIEFTAFGKLIPLLVVVIVGTAFIDKENLNWTITPTISNVGSASLLLFFAFMGFETPLSNGGEVNNAKRTVPLALLIGISSVLILYLSIQWVTQGVLGGTIEAHKDAPLAAVAGVIFGKGGLVLITVAISISMLGALGGEILSVPRILFAGARDGLMPGVLSRIHPRFATPYVAILVYVTLGVLFSISGGFRQLAIISSASTLVIYFGVVLATLKLRKTGLPMPEKTFKAPGGFIVPILAMCVIVWLLSSLPGQELLGMLIFIVIFSLIFFSTKALKKKN